MEEKKFKDRYKFIEQAGKGGQGLVERCLDTVTGEEVAIKIINDVPINDTTEYDIVINLNHKNILKPRDLICKTDEVRKSMKMKIIYPYIDINLDNYIKIYRNSQQGFPESEAFILIQSMTEALLYLKQKEIAHRDIKPQNILVKVDKNKGDPFFFLIDFGVSKPTEEVTVEQSLVGTLYYLSPELEKVQNLNGQKVICNYYKSDIFSLGLVFLEVLTLEPVKKQGFNKDENINKLKQVIEKIQNKELQGMVANMLRFDPDQRPTLEELMKLLNENFVIKMKIYDYQNSGTMKYSLELSEMQTVYELYQAVNKILALKEISFVLLVSQSPKKLKKLPWKDFKKTLRSYNLTKPWVLYIMPFSNEARYQIIVSYFYENVPLEEIEEKFSNIIKKTLDCDEVFDEKEICYDQDCLCTVVPHIKYLEEPKFFIIGIKEAVLNTGKFFVILDGNNLKPMKFAMKYVETLIKEIKGQMHWSDIEDVLKKEFDPTYVFQFNSRGNAEVLLEILRKSIKKFWPNLEVKTWGFVNEAFLFSYHSIKNQ